MNWYRDLLVSFCTCLVALKLRSLRFHSPRLCRTAVFLIQTNVSLSRTFLRLCAAVTFFAVHSFPLLYARACRSEVIVTSSSLPLICVAPRYFNTNPRSPSLE